MKLFRKKQKLQAVEDCRECACDKDDTKCKEIQALGYIQTRDGCGFPIKGKK